MLRAAINLLGGLFFSLLLFGGAGQVIYRAVTTGQIPGGRFERILTFDAHPVSFVARVSGASLFFALAGAGALMLGIRTSAKFWSAWKRTRDIQSMRDESATNRNRLRALFGRGKQLRS